MVSQGLNLITVAALNVLGDKNQLFQVIMNLLTKGIQAMDTSAGTGKRIRSRSLAPVAAPQALQHHGLWVDSRPRAGNRIYHCPAGPQREHR